MDIYFADLKFQKICIDRKLFIRKYGQRMADVVKRRLDDLDAADSLEEMRNLPGRCHQLKGNRAEQISLDLVHPQRLIFASAEEAVPKRLDGSLDWAQVKSITILGIEDTHE